MSSGWPSDGPIAGRRPKGSELGLPPDGPGSLAGIGRRFVGLFIDGLLFIPLLALSTALRHPHLVTQVSASGVHTQRLVESPMPLAGALAVMAPSAIYVIGMIAWRGQTLGEQAMGLRVVRLIDGQHPGLTPSLARWAVLAVAGLAGLFASYLVGWLTLWTLAVYLWATWDPNRQGLHDRFARVIVINTR